MFFILSVWERLNMDWEKWEEERKSADIFVIWCVCKKMNITSDILFVSRSDVFNFGGQLYVWSNFRRYDRCTV